MRRPRLRDHCKYAQFEKYALLISLGCAGWRTQNECTLCTASCTVHHIVCIRRTLNCCRIVDIHIFIKSQLLVSRIRQTLCEALMATIFFFLLVSLYRINDVRYYDLLAIQQFKFILFNVNLKFENIFFNFQ